MIFTQNIHPDKKWVKVDAMVWGPDAGSCLKLVLTDESGKDCVSIIHYGYEKNRNEFVLMVREAISKLPVKCDSCGKEIK